MQLSREDVEKVALLARLKLSGEEADRLAAELSHIVGYVEQLGAIDTSGVAPMAHAVELTNVFVPDVLHTSLPREAALANAPKHDDECYRVPAVLGE